MGSSGTGKFTDYPGTPRGSAKKRSESGAPPSLDEQGDECERRLENIALEEVDRCDYFKAHTALPPAGMDVRIRSALVGGRIGVEVIASQEVLGLLPTQFNYLLQCMKQGYRYAGQVKSAKLRPVAVVRVDLEHER
jgi:hypothetical protein